MKKWAGDCHPPTVLPLNFAPLRDHGNRDRRGSRAAAPIADRIAEAIRASETRIGAVNELIATLRDASVAAVAKPANREGIPIRVGIIKQDQYGDGRILDRGGAIVHRHGRLIQRGGR